MFQQWNLLPYCWPKGNVFSLPLTLYTPREGQHPLALTFRNEATKLTGGICSSVRPTSTGKSSGTRKAEVNQAMISSHQGTKKRGNQSFHAHPAESQLLWEEKMHENNSLLEEPRRHKPFVQETRGNLKGKALSPQRTFFLVRIAGCLFFFCPAFYGPFLVPSRVSNNAKTLFLTFHTL